MSHKQQRFQAGCKYQNISLLRRKHSGSVFILGCSGRSPHLQTASHLHGAAPLRIGRVIFPFKEFCPKMTPCRLCRAPEVKDIARRFIRARLTAMKMEVKGPTKRHYTSIVLQGVTSRRTVIFNKTHSRTETLDGRVQSITASKEILTVKCLSVHRLHLPCSPKMGPVILHKIRNPQF